MIIRIMCWTCKKEFELEGGEPDLHHYLEKDVLALIKWLTKTHPNGVPTYRDSSYQMEHGPPHDVSIMGNMEAIAG